MYSFSCNEKKSFLFPCACFLFFFLILFLLLKKLSVSCMKKKDVWFNFMNRWNVKQYSVDCLWHYIFLYCWDSQKVLKAEVTVHHISNNKCDILALFPLIWCSLYMYIYIQGSGKYSSPSYFPPFHPCKWVNLWRSNSNVSYYLNLFTTLSGEFKRRWNCLQVKRVKITL